MVVVFEIIGIIFYVALGRPAKNIYFVGVLTFDGDWKLGD